MRKVVFFDVDGVLLEWFKPFIEYANECGVPLSFDDITGYNLELLPCWDNPMHCFKMIGDFAKTDEWLNLPVLGHPTALHALKNMGYELRVLSQVSNLEGQKRRIAALSNIYGPVFSGIHFTTHKTKKSDWLVNFMEDAGDDPEVYMLDDKPETLLELALIRRDREFNDHGSRLHPIAINNLIDHPYLTEHIKALHEELPGCFDWCRNVQDFVEGRVSQDLAYGG